MSAYAAWLLISSLLSHNHCEFLKKLCSWFQTTTTTSRQFKMKRNLILSTRERFMDPWSKDASETWPNGGIQMEETTLVLSRSVLPSSSPKASFTFLVFPERERKRKMPLSLKEVGLACLVIQISSSNLSFSLTLRKELWLVHFDQVLLFSPVNSETYMYKVMIVKMVGRDCHYTWEHKIQDSIPSGDIYHRTTVLV